MIKFLCFEDDFKTQVLSAKKQLQEAQELHNKVDAKLNTALHNVRAVQEEKGTLEAKLGQKQAILQAQVRKLWILALHVKKSLSYRFYWQKSFIHFLFLPCILLALVILSVCYLIALYLVKRIKLLNSLLCSFLQLPVFFLSCTKHSPQHLQSLFFCYTERPSTTPIYNM